MDDQQQKEKIRELNDRLRTTFEGGQVYITVGVQQLGERLCAEAIAAVMAFDAFDQDNDPHGEHDYGTIQVGGRTIAFKLDVYDLRMRFMSPDPADPRVSRRVLTILLASEW